MGGMEQKDVLLLRTINHNRGTDEYLSLAHPPSPLPIAPSSF